MKVEPLPNTILTKRQTELTKKVAEGKTTAKIANEICRTESLVNSSISDAMDRLGASNRAHLVAIAIHRGIITLKGAILAICVFGTVYNDMDARNLRHRAAQRITSRHNNRNWEIRV